MPQVNLDIPRMYPPQLEFCRSTFVKTLYGGARGGGKSFAVRWKAVQLAFKYPGITILIVRRTLKELENNHLKEFKRMFKGIATYSETKKQFVLENGSTIIFGYMATDGDAEQYQGQNIEVIFMDEATHFTYYMYMKLDECNRLSNNVDEKLGLRPRMYLTANPGGVGHLWVKRLFIDRKYTPDENPDDYTFIPARVYDNEFIMKNDPKYVEKLKSLPEAERRAMLDGEWDAFEGQFFPEFDEELHTYDPNTTLIPHNVIRYRTRDYGLDMLACYWIAITEDKTCYVYRELAQSNLTVKQSGDLINDMTDYNERIYKDICPPDLWSRNSVTGKSPVEILRKECNQIPLKSNNERENGWLFLKELLMINPRTKKPFLQISNTCTELIHSMKMIQFDEKKPNDAAKVPHEITHFPDAMRYFAITYTRAADEVPPAPTTTTSTMADYYLNMGKYAPKDDLWEDYGDGFGGYYI